MCLVPLLPGQFDQWALSFGVSMISVSTRLHVPGVDEEDQRAVRADPGFAQHALAHGLELGLGGMDIGDFVAHVVLAARRVLLEEAGDAGVAGQGLDQLNLGAVQGPVRARSIDEADLYPLRFKIERFVDFGRAHDVAVEHDRCSNRGRGNTDMVESAEFHAAGSTETGKLTELAM